MSILVVSRNADRSLTPGCLSPGLCPEVGEEPASGLFSVVMIMAAEQFALRFYSSEAWKKCRSEFKKSKGKLCECHKIKLTQENINDPEITLNWDNLELLCQQCHIERHADEDRQNTGRWKIGENGEVIVR